jgi:hypothetical protein
MRKLGQIFASWIQDTRTRRTIELIAIVWALALADLLFTIWAQRFTPFTELNPLARPFVQHNDVLLLTVLKIVSTTVSTGIFWFLRRTPRAEWGLWLSVLIYVGLMVRWYYYTGEVLAIGDRTRIVQVE